MDAASQPVEVDVDRQQGITLTWDDGSTSHFGLEELRWRCPCAECRGLRGQEKAIWPKPGDPLPLEIVSVEMTGGWGISVTWNDRHSTGIYAWEHLRS